MVDRRPAPSPSGHRRSRGPPVGPLARPGYALRIVRATTHAIGSLHRFGGSDDVFGAVAVGGRDVGSSGSALRGDQRLAFGEGAVWAFGARRRSHDPRRTRSSRRSRSAEPEAGRRQPTALAVGEGRLWSRAGRCRSRRRPSHANAQRGNGLRIDRRRTRSQRPCAWAPIRSGIAVGEGAVWVSNRRGFLDHRIDRSRARLRTRVRSATVRTGSPPGTACLGQRR